MSRLRDHRRLPAEASGKMAAFRQLIDENARASCRDEPGCRRFDVLRTAASDPDRILLYEIYDDRAAFDAHLQDRAFRGLQ